MGRVLGPGALLSLAAGRPERFELEDGRCVEPGDQIRVEGEGHQVFIIKHLHINGDVTAYGPVNRNPNGHRSYRSFPLSAVRPVTRPVKRRDA